MSLIPYYIEYESLSPEERNTLFEQIDNVSYTGFQITPNFSSGTFFLESENDLELIHFPEGCHLKKKL